LTRSREQIGECLGFKLTTSGERRSLVTDVVERPGDIVISTSYATEERAKAADFITYSKVSTGFWSPRAIERIDAASICRWRRCGSREHRLRRVPLVQALIPQCKAAGSLSRPPALREQRQLHPGHSRGRADTYVNDVNTVDQA